MNLENIKMIVTDLDQTLLRTNKDISLYTLQILKICKEKNIKIIIATARSEKSASRYIKQIEPDFIISNGGALLRKNDLIIYRMPLSASTGNLLLSEFVSNPLVSKITADTDQGYFVNFHFYDSPDYTHAIYNDFSLSLNSEAYKITVEIMEPGLAGLIANKFEECRMIAFTGEPWYRFAHRNATKWTAIESLLGYTGLKPENVCSFGDDYNDLEMIEKSGIGVAVKNAIPEVKLKADYITDENDKDGVANFIKRNIISNYT